jgi:hypothetical protein
MGNLAQLQMVHILKKTERCLSKKCIGLVLFDGNMSAIEYRRLFKIRLSFVCINFISCSFRQTVCWDWESMTIKLIGFYLISYIPCLWFRDKSQYSTIGFGYVSHEWHVFSIFCYMWIICTIIIFWLSQDRILMSYWQMSPNLCLQSKLFAFYASEADNWGHELFCIYKTDNQYSFFSKQSKAPSTTYSTL